MVAPIDYQNLIITSLSEADPTAREELQHNVPLYWQLFARTALPELRYWYCRREAIRMLMGCLRSEVDYIRRHQDDQRTSFNTARQDSNMLARSVDDGSGRSDRAMSSHYDDETNASGSASSSRARNSAESASDVMNYNDSGSGSSSSIQTGTIDGTSTDDGTTHDKNRVDGLTERELNDVHNFNSHVDQVENSFSIGSGGAQSTMTTSRPQALNYTNLDTTQYSHDKRDTQHEMTRHDERNNHNTVDNETNAHASFQANAIGNDNGVSTMNMTGSGSSQSEDHMTGAGSGAMASSGSGATTSLATGSRAAHADGETHMGMQSTTQMNSLMERLHQRFEHLQLLWKNADEMVAWYEKQRLLIAPYVLRAITIQFPEGGDQAIANAYLIKTPMGIGPAR